MSDQATILHADLDSFFASVEQRDDPGLRGKPVLVGGGVVLACSYEAKAHGVTGGMGGAEARRLCPGAVTVPPRMEAYSQASKDVFEVFEDTTPLVEGISIDEAFLDVRGMERIAGTPRKIAERLRRRVRDQVGLPITVGVAATKHLAKVASAEAKPDGLLVVEPGHELEFLHPLAVEKLWGVGPVSAAKLHARGITTVADAARLEETELTEILGRAGGRQLHALAHNRDPRPVKTRTRRRSIGSQRALGRRTPKTPEALDATVVAIADRLGGRLRAAQRLCRTVVLRLRFSDFSRATRSHTIGYATAQTGTILATARELLTAALPEIEARGITLIGLTLSNLENAGAGQLPLPLGRQGASALDVTVDNLRDRFGAESVTRAVLIDRDPGVSMPLLPD